MSEEGETIPILACKYVLIFKAVTQACGYNNVLLSVAKKKKKKIERFLITLEFSTVCNETFLKDTMKSHVFTTLIF